jgi:hypothetical protein
MNMRKSAKIGIAVAIVAAIIIGSVVYHLTRPKGSELETKARNFVELLGSGEFDDAYGLFNEQMTEAITVEDLEAIWNDTINQVGEFKGVVKTRTATEMGYELVYVTTEFESASLDIQVAFDEESKIAGFHFFPVGS